MLFGMSWATDTVDALAELVDASENVIKGGIVGAGAPVYSLYSYSMSGLFLCLVRLMAL